MKAIPSARTAAGLSLGALGAMLLAAGCGGAKETLAGGEEVVDTSRDERPAWLTGRGHCPEEKVCAIGTRTRASALEHARTDARHDAIQELSTRLETKTEQTFGYGREEGAIPELGEDNRLEEATKEMYAAASRIAVQGMTEEDFWWRRVRSLGDDGRYRYYFDYNVQISIPEHLWQQKLKAILDRERGRALSEGEEELVRELDTMTNRLLEEGE